MKKISKVLATTLLASSFASVVVPPAHAQTGPDIHPVDPEPYAQVSDDLISKADPYIQFDGSKYYIINEVSLLSLVGSDNLATVKEQISSSNDSLSELNTSTMVVNTNDRSITYTDASDTKDPGSTQMFASSYVNGVNKVTWHWWGARVYVSKNTIRNIGVGITIGGIWIPQPVISKVVSTVGVVYSVCPGGIRFDVSAWNIVKMTMGPRIPISNVHWQ